MCVFDPCAARNDPELHSAVRKIAAESGIALEELYYSGERARCCGWGGHVISANPVLADRMVNNRIHASENPYVTYCTNCRDTFAWKGKDCVHALDLVFGLHRDGYVPPSLGMRRRNKLLTKKMLLEQFFGETQPEIPGPNFSVKVEIPGDMMEKLYRLLILEEEVCKTIEYCESTGYKFYDKEINCFTGHLRIGIITYWVSYEKHGDRCILINAYSHRMAILDELGGGI
jgi:hypothetical protein